MNPKNLLLILSLSLCFFTQTLFAQSPNFIWAKEIGGTGNEEGQAIAIDASGNVYITGTFSGTVDFDPGVGTFNLTSAGGSGIFISKLDDSGNFVWAKAMSGTVDGYSYSIALDASGNVYIAGFFQGTVDFDPGVGIFNLTSAGGYDIFITKLDSLGNFVWAKRMGGAGEDYGKATSVDASGNVYTIGSFHGTVDFDPGTGIYNLTSAGNNDIFISKLDSSGNFVWAKKIGGTNDDFGIALAIDSSANVYITGNFRGTADFNPGSGTFNLTSAGNDDIFISKLDSSGNFVWAKAIGGAGYDGGQSLVLDPAASGDIYTTGFFAGTVDFDPGAGVFNLTSTGGNAIFISKSDSAGNFVWAKAMGGTSGNIGYSIALDPSGNVYTTGEFYGTTDFDPGAGIFNLTSAGYTDIFISKLDSVGNFVWAKAMGGTDYDHGSSIALNASGNAYMSGFFFSPSISFGSTTLTNAGNYDMFIAKLDNTITGIESVKDNNRISFYPNPANNYFTIALGSNNKKIKITITDITGKIIYTTTATETQNIEVNIKDFAEGIYVVRIQTEDFLQTEKLIVQK
jgi:hypothetical protein